MSAWLAMIPERAGRKDLHAAITLNGLAMNVSRAIGPGLADYITALTSPRAEKSRVIFTPENP